jgi:uncharacterized phage infection (PIP) family protein YhgE
MWFKSPDDRGKLWKEVQKIRMLLGQQKADVALSGGVSADSSGGASGAGAAGGLDISTRQMQQHMQSSRQLHLQVQQMMQQQRQMHARIQQQQQILQQQQMHIQQQQIQLTAAQAKPPQVQPPVSGLTAGQVELSSAQLQKILMRMVQDERFVGALHAQYVKAQRKKRAAAAAAGQ